MKNRLNKLFIFLFSFVVVDFFKYKKLSKHNRFPLKLNNLKPIKNEKTVNTKFDRHYIYHPAWAARILAKIKPEKHVDISSTLHFSAITSAFIKIEFYDYRPAKLQLDNFSSKHADLLSLHFQNNSIKSLSCMHTVEHVGLGRYGDPINPDGDLVAMSELERVLAINGDLLFVVPIGKPKVMFNAHRVYSYKQIIKSFPKLTLKEFTLIPDNSKDGDLIRNASEKIADSQSYGCGCFWFKK